MHTTCCHPLSTGPIFLLADPLTLEVVGQGRPASGVRSRLNLQYIRSLHLLIMPSARLLSQLSITGEILRQYLCARIANAHSVLMLLHLRKPSAGLGEGEFISWG